MNGQRETVGNHDMYEMALREQVYPMSSMLIETSRTTAGVKGAVWRRALSKSVLAASFQAIRPPLRSSILRVILVLFGNM